MSAFLLLLIICFVFCFINFKADEKEREKIHEAGVGAAVIM